MSNIPSRRAFLILAAGGLVAACSEQKAIVSRSIASQITITDVQLDMSNIPLNSKGNVRTGRQIVLTRERLGKDIDVLVTRAVAARDFNGPVKATLKIVPSSIMLVSPGQAWAVGGRSNIEGIVSLTSASGQQLLAPTTIKGFSETFRASGLIGAMTSPEADQDYQQTVNGFAQNAMRKLFEDVTIGVDGAVLD